MIIAAVGSTNPVKLAAARSVLRLLYDNAIEVLAVPVDSGVPAQPWGDAETRRGAINRALAAQATTAATWGLGLEGGVLEISEGAQGISLFTSAWCAVINEQGVLGIAGGANLLLPPSVSQALRDGRELGVAIDELIGQEGTHQRGGAIGALTLGRSSRQVAFEHVLTLAFARLLTPHYYTDQGT